MRKNILLLLAASTLSLAAGAQRSKWFVSVATGFSIGGPVTSITNNMKKSRLDQTSKLYVLNILTFSTNLSTSTNYPTSFQNFPLLLKFGKRLSDKRSLYIMGGLSNSGGAEGFKIAGTDTVNGLLISISSTQGPHVAVTYKIYQIAAGYQYEFSKAHAKMAVAPSLFLFAYKNTRASTIQRHTAVMPGIAFTGRLPLGKAKRLIGVDLMAELNLVPPVKMQALNTEYTYEDKISNATLASSNVNLVHGMLGFALSLRK